MNSKILTILLLVFSATIGYSQSPNTLNYQAALRNAEGVSMNSEPVLMGFLIRQGNSDGVVVYEEEYNTSTNEFGLVDLEIGNGTSIIGNFADIDWATGPYFLEVVANGSPIGVQELASVPYSLFATEAATAVDDFDRNPENEIQTISLAENTISLSNGGGAIELPQMESHWLENGPNLIAENMGNVAIGLDDPAQKLHVRGRVRADFFQNEGGINKWIEIGHGGSNGFINMNGNSGSGRMDFRHNDLTQMSLTEGGLFGVGVEDPLERLHVRGRMRADFFQEEGGINKWIEIGHGGSNGFINMNGNSGSGRMDFRHNDMTQMSITEAGLVGIGMESPEEQLHVRGRVRADFFQESGSINKWIEIGHGGSNGFINMNGNSGSGRMDFRHNDMTQMSITEDGRVGIGTGSPEELLHVNGNIRLLDDSDIFGLDQIVGTNDLRFYGDSNTDEHPDFLILPNGRAGFRAVQDIAGVNIRAIDGELITLRVENAAGSPLFQVSGEGNAGLNQWWDNVTMNVRGRAGNPWYFLTEAPDGAELFSVTSNGNVNVTNNISKGGGSFKIDHPLDPENQFLYHSFVESPDMMNIYNGNVVTDGAGFATVELPDYFASLNKDYRYQLTVIGSFAQAIIKNKVDNNQFVIQTDQPGVEVSWQVTGIRQDPYANQNRIPNAVDKAPEERGLYLHPEAYGQPATRGIGSKKAQSVANQ